MMVFIRERGLRGLIRTLPDGHAQDFPAFFRAPGHLRFRGVIRELEPKGLWGRAPPENEFCFHRSNGLDGQIDNRAPDEAGD